MSQGFISRCAALTAVVVGVLWGQPAHAALCVDKPSIGERITKAWRDKGGEKGVLGCALTHERDVPDHDGRYVQFLHGRIVWSPTQKMLIVANEATRPGSHASAVDLEWTIENNAFEYEFFIVRPFLEGDTEDDTNDRQEDVGSGSRGAYRIEERGHFVIRIEGCNRGGFLEKSTCPQGWSNPVEIDAGYVDMSRTWERPPFGDADKRPGLDRRTGIFLNPPKTAAEAQSTTYDRWLVAVARTCDGGLGEEVIEDTAFAALAKLDAAANPEIAPLCAGMLDAEKSARTQQDRDKVKTDASARLRQQVNAWLSDKEPSGDVGTGVERLEGAGLSVAGGAVAGGAAVGGLPGAVVGAAIAFGAAAATSACSRTGNYDFALTALIPIMYDHRTALSDRTYRHVLDVLLDQRGGADQVSDSVSRCGFKFPETENHMAMTEAARYLTNQLLLKQAAEDHDANTEAFAAADRKYNNERNGMNEWMLQHLQGFLKNDFHEYNSKPYVRLTVKALQNLAAYADPAPPNQKVGLAATMVLHHLAGRFAVSSSELRKASPFRRQGKLKDMPELLGRHSDGESWRFLLLTGNTDVLLKERFGRANWVAHSTMSHPRVKPGTKTMRYQLPPLIADLIVNDRHRTFWQGIRHEGVEINAATPDFLISGGGRWEPRTTRDMLWGSKVLKAFSVDPKDTHGNAMPTTLMPTAHGDDLNDLIRIKGHSDREKRNNTCVGPGFACGLNPSVPDAMLRRFPARPRPCRFGVSGEIALQWRRQRAEHGPLGCPIEKERGTPGSSARIQEFERGQIVWSPPQQMAVSAYYTQGRDAITVDWQIAKEFSYDFFIIRWDKDGRNIAQRDRQSDDVGASSTSGQWTFPLAGQGVYTIVVEGCESHTLSSSTCDQKWSHPVTIEYPSKGSCARGVGDWIFVNASGECNPNGPGPGYFVATYSKACAKGDKCEDERFGFFEVRKPVCSAGSGGFDTVKPSPSPRRGSSPGSNTVKPSPRDELENNSGPSASVEGAWADDADEADEEVGTEAGADTLDSSCLDFQGFIDDVLARNGRTTFTSRDQNDYRMPGRVITFVPNHSRSSTGIVRIDGKLPTVPSKIDDWGVEAGQPRGDGLLGATGDIISADGRGCVVIRNPALGQSLILDMRDWRHPASRLDTSSGARTCKDVKSVRAPGDTQ
jgi:hypothetical protein